jgi:hypothetical protein
LPRFQNTAVFQAEMRGKAAEMSSKRIKSGTVARSGFILERAEDFLTSSGFL